MKKFHAHIYFSSANRESAVSLREQILKMLPLQRMSGLIDKCVGPHTSPMFNFTFVENDYEEIKIWLEENRGEFSVLIHPLSADELRDHTENALWLGERLAINTAIFN